MGSCFDHLKIVFLVPFLLAPIVNVWTFKFFVDVLGVNSFMYVLPWGTPTPIGIILGTGMGLLQRWILPGNQLRCKL